MYAALNKALVIDPSGELRDFLRFCAGRLAKDPNERFQSAADVLDGINWLCLASG